MYGHICKILTCLQLYQLPLRRVRLQRQDMLLPGLAARTSQLPLEICQVVASQSWLDPLWRQLTQYGFHLAVCQTIRWGLQEICESQLYHNITPDCRGPVCSDEQDCWAHSWLGQKCAARNDGHAGTEIETRRWRSTCWGWSCQSSLSLQEQSSVRVGIIQLKQIHGGSHSLNGCRKDNTDRISKTCFSAYVVKFWFRERASKSTGK